MVKMVSFSCPFLFTSFLIFFFHFVYISIHLIEKEQPKRCGVCLGGQAGSRESHLGSFFLSHVELASYQHSAQPASQSHVRVQVPGWLADRQAASASEARAKAKLSLFGLSLFVVTGYTRHPGLIKWCWRRESNLCFLNRRKFVPKACTY